MVEYISALLYWSSRVQFQGKAEMDTYLSYTENVIVWANAILWFDAPAFVVATHNSCCWMDSLCHKRAKTSIFDTTLLQILFKTVLFQNANAYFKGWGVCSEELSLKSALRTSCIGWSNRATYVSCWHTHLSPISLHIEYKWLRTPVQLVFLL